MATYNNFDDLFKDLEKEVKENPGKYLDEQAKEVLVGKKTTGICPECNSKSEVEILENGKVKCLKCGNVFNMIINWDIK